MPTVLLLALEFPPLARVSVHRSLQFAKHLPSFGIQPVVVTADQLSLESWFGPAREHALLHELPTSVEIRRVPCPRPPQKHIGRLRRWGRHFSSVDETIAAHWEPELLRVWDALVAETKPLAVVVSIPPYSVARLAVKLARLSSLPLIIDFRDNWSQFCAGAKPTWIHYLIQLKRERKCLEAAAAVVGVTRQVVQDLHAAHPHIPDDRFHVIPNGYDGDLAHADTALDRATTDQKFVIGYVGSFYYTPDARATVMEPWWRRPPQHWLHYSPRREDWLYRSPWFFFRALRELFQQSPGLRTRIRVRFVGDSPVWLHEQVRQFELSDVIEHVGRLAHRDCLAFQSDCDALLMTSAKVLGGRDYCIAGKTFEYIKVGRPILAFVTEGEQRDFLKESGMACLCDPDDSFGSAKKLADMVAGKLRFVPDLSFLQRFQRRESAQKLAVLIEALGQRDLSASPSFAGCAG